MPGLLAAQPGRTLVRVSAPSCRLRFIACGPECISKKGCTAKCCDAPTHPTGIRVHVSPAEARALGRIGVTCAGGFIQPMTGERRCPVKTAGHLCGLWQKPERPLGCIVSPFAFNKQGTMIIRNRYKLLPCYDPEYGEPAYRTFRSSLIAAFGSDETNRLTRHLDKGGGDLQLYMPTLRHKLLMGRENALQADTARRENKGA